MSSKDRISKKSDRTGSELISKLALTFDVLRVTPTHVKPAKNQRTDRLSDLLIILFIFGIAMWIRFYVRLVFIGEYTEGFFHVTVKEGDPLGFGNFLGIKTGETAQTEGYVDFSHYYVPYVDAFVDKDWNPYSGNLEEGDALNGYVYGPIYIYLIAIGKAWFDLSAYDSVVYSNLIFDSLTYVMVYVLAKRVTGNVIAMLIAAIGSFSPVALFYANIRVLNAPQMNFFVLLFIYLFLEHRDTIGMFILAVATLTKQVPLFLVMPVGFFMVRRYGFFKGTTFIILYFIFILMLSIPWIILTPVSYYTRLFLPGGGKDQINCPGDGEATNLVAATIDIDTCENGPIVYSDPVIFEWIESLFGLSLFNLVNSHYLFFGSLFILAWVGFTGYDYMEKNPQMYFRFYGAYFALAHATIARGIYKYYLTFLMPFFLLAIVPGNTVKSAHIRIGALMNRGWSTWIDPRYRMKKPSLSYWALFFILICSIIGIFMLIDASISLFTTTAKYHNLWLVILIPLSVFFMLRPSPVDIKESNETISQKEYEHRYYEKLVLAFGFVLLFLFVITFFGGIFFLGLFYYFYYFLFIIILIFLIFTILLSISYVIHSVTKSDRVFNSFILDYSQLLIDLIWLAINFYLFYFINQEIFLIHRYFTSVLVLASSIFLMGTLGGEIWGSFIRVPVNALVRFQKIIFN